MLVHATDDLGVFYHQSTRMFDRLREVGVPAQLFTVNPSGAPVGQAATSTAPTR